MVQVGVVSVGASDISKLGNGLISCTLTGEGALPLTSLRGREALPVGRIRRLARGNKRLENTLGNQDVFVLSAFRVFIALLFELSHMNSQRGDRVRNLQRGEGDSLWCPGHFSLLWAIHFSLP